jgi:hypothetical protein
VEKNF